MNLAAHAVRRPVLTTMTALIVVTLGLVAATRLTVDLLPSIEKPRISIRGNYPGASPEVVEQSVTRIIEGIVSTVPGVRELNSTSSRGHSRTRIVFDDSIDIDTAALDVQARLDEERNEFPDAVGKLSVDKFDLDTAPVVVLGISSALDPVELTEIIENDIRNALSRIPGVAQVDPWGGFDPEIRIELDPDRIRAFDLPLDRVVAAIEQANLNLPAGEIVVGNSQRVLRSPAEFTSLDEIRDLVVARRDGVPIRLAQVADVLDTYRPLSRYVRVNGYPGTRLAVRKEAEANTVAVSEAIIAELDNLRRELPLVEIVLLKNQGSFIAQSIRNVGRSVMYGGLLAVVVLLLFLRDWRATAVVATAIPISILATLAVMFLTGMTLNLMTLGGLALGVGMMVDSAIVVLENIVRRRDELHEPPARAAAAGAAEVAGAITASTVTTLVIFLPLVFVRGVTADLFKPFAYVVAASLGCSLVVALTLVPMLASRFLARRNTRAAAPAAAPPPSAAPPRRPLLQRVYDRLLAPALARPALTLLVAAALVAASTPLAPLIGSELLPRTDEGEVGLAGEMDVGTRLDVVDAKARALEAAVRERVPEVVGVIASVGPNNWRPDSGATANLDIDLVPATDRERTNQDVANQLRRELKGRIPGMEIRAWAPGGQNFLNRVLPGGGGLRVDVRGYDLPTLDRLTDAAVAAIESVPGVTKADAGARVGAPLQDLRIDRERAADLGLSVRDIARALQTAMAGRDAGEFRTRGENLPIRVQFRDAKAVTPEQILGMTIQPPGAADAVPLRAVATISESTAPSKIDRRNRQRSFGISVDIDAEAADTGSVAAGVRRALADIPVPPGHAFVLGGGYEEQQRSTRELQVSILLALGLVYMVLASQYESLRAPLVVMLSVPTAAIGVLLMLYLTGTTFNIQSYIGCIMLAGIAVNNAILLVDQARQLAAEGRGKAEAVAEAGRRRLRPILMTTATTLLGLLPLALAIGEGAEAQAPLARAVIGGLLASTAITLLVVPAGLMLVTRRAAEPRQPAPARGAAAPAATLLPLLLAVPLVGCTTGGIDWTAQIPTDTAHDSPPADIIRTAPGPPPLQALRDSLGAPADVVPLTLEDDLALAASGNPGLGVRRYDPALAVPLVALERGRFDPESFVDVTYRESSRSETDRGTGGQFNSDRDSFDVEAGLRQRLPTGTEVEVGLLQTRDISNRSPEQQESRLGFTVTQALLQGRGPAANLVAVRQAELEVVASIHELRAFTETIVARAERRFWSLALSLRRLEVTRAAVALARRQLEETAARIDAGVLADADEIVAESEVARRLQSLINAQADAAADRVALRLVLGLTDADDADDADPAEAPALLLPEYDAAALSPTADAADAAPAARSRSVTLALQQRPELAEARVRLRQERLETIATRNGLLPRLDVFISLGRSGFGGDVGETYDDLSDPDTDSYDLLAGVTYRRDLGNNEAEARHARAFARRRQAVAAIDNLRAQVVAEVRSAWVELDRARQQVEASATASRLARRVVEVEQERFNAGLTASILLAQAQRDLLEAELDEAGARVAYRLALLDLHLAEGTLLERRGVAVALPDGADLSL